MEWISKLNFISEQNSTMCDCGLPGFSPAGRASYFEI